MNTLETYLMDTTESAAWAAYQWLGRGDKNSADDAAVTAMRCVLDHAPMSGNIVIGEGEIDEAPMLYIGEKLGMGGPCVDIAVDPIDGTRMVASGQSNAIVAIAVTPAGGLLSAPDMYMEKIATGPASKNAIDLNQSPIENAKNVAAFLNKPLRELTIATLAKPRHETFIRDARALGIKVVAPQDGDIITALLACYPDHAIDMMYTIGGAPEGVIAAAAVRALQGNFQGRLMMRTHVKGNTPENEHHTTVEMQRCRELSLSIDTVLTLDCIVSTDDILFVTTGITQSDLLQGVMMLNANSYITETLCINGCLNVKRHIKTTHFS